MKSFCIPTKVSLGGVLSTALGLWFTLASLAAAHEVLPAIGDLSVVDGQVRVDISANLESFVADIDLDGLDDTGAAPQAAAYDELRALSPDELSARFIVYWPQMAAAITLQADGVDLPMTLGNVSVPAVGDTDVVRASTFTFTAPLPDGAQSLIAGWEARFGVLVLRQMGVDAPYDGYLDRGALSDPINIAGGNQASGWQTFVNYVPVGFDHIVPKGLDHILFVLGLFFLAARIRPLIWQVSAFTLAHTITLALAALGYVNVPGSIVEPLIAASIVYVAVENIFAKGLNPWRPLVIFGFGLLHGLGFASVLAEFGLPESAFVPALIGFNIGVEVGQLFVITAMFLCVWQAIRVDRGRNEVMQATALYGVLLLATGALCFLSWPRLSALLEMSPLVFIIPLAAIFFLCLLTVSLHDQLHAYRRIVAVPASVAIAIVGAYWFVERVFF